jgi:hypothetical protein
MYTKESLISEGNESYNGQHFLSDLDVEVANTYALAVRRSRSFRPKCGDIVKIKGEEKIYHVEKIDDNGFLDLCAGFYVPFTSVRFTGGCGAEISTSTSGGPWRTDIAADSVKKTGTMIRRFCFWGHCGPTGNGAVDFKAEVNVFELK